MIGSLAHLTRAAAIRAILTGQEHLTRPLAYRHYWELCTLLGLRDALRSGDMWVPGSRRLASAFWYLLPFFALALLLALLLKQIPLADVAGMVARGEAIGSEEAERLEAEQLAERRADRANPTADRSNSARC